MPLLYEVQYQHMNEIGLCKKGFTLDGYYSNIDGSVQIVVVIRSFKS